MAGIIFDRWQVEYNSGIPVYRQIINQACAAVAAWCVPSQAALSGGQKLAAEALVKQFTAADFDARQTGPVHPSSLDLVLLHPVLVERTPERFGVLPVADGDQVTAELVALPHSHRPKPDAI